MNYNVRSAGHGCLQISAPSSTPRLVVYQSSHRRLPFSNKSASFGGDTAPIDLRAYPGSSIKQTLWTPVKDPSLGADVKELFFLFRSFPLFLNKDANPLLWLQSRARWSKNKSEKQTSWCQAEGCSVQQTKHYCFLLYRSSWIWHRLSFGRQCHADQFKR